MLSLRFFLGGGLKMTKIVAVDWKSRPGFYSSVKWCNIIYCEPEPQGETWGHHGTWLSKVRAHYELLPNGLPSFGSTTSWEGLESVELRSIWLVRSERLAGTWVTVGWWGTVTQIIQFPSQPHCVIFFFHRLDSTHWVAMKEVAPHNYSVLLLIQKQSQ